ncbi:MAG: hypothetical protein FIB01_11460, partial [Gemmatimonadetes bacterium]|nr:hypothetical protein [Gemmatimonadota bacterium]
GIGGAGGRAAESRSASTAARACTRAPGEVALPAYATLFPGPAGPHEVTADANAPAAGGVRRRFPRRVLLLAGGLAGVTLAFSVWLGFLAPGPAEPTAYRIAVLPFAVRGPAEFTYLREGVVDLLSADLEGAGPFRTVDPQAVLNLTRDPRNAPPAAELAQRLGAGMFVRGDVVVAGGRMRMSAGIYQREPGGPRGAEAVVDGPPGSLFLQVGRLAAQLLAASGSPVPPLGRLAALTTTSLPALKAYLEGESEYRDGLYAGAFESFRRASDLDTTFALAHYRVAQAANWAVPPGWGWDSILVRSRLAAAHAQRLAPRPRLLVEAYAAWMAGAYDDAERRYRAVVRTYPDEVEAWYGLAEVLFHMNPVRGRPTVESGRYFERVLELEPENLAALSHLLRVSLREGQNRCADTVAQKLDRLQAPPATAEYHALRAFATGSAGERDRAVAELRASGNDELVRITANRLAVYGRSLDGARRVLPLLLSPGLAPDVRAHAHVWLGELDVARGQWQAADRALAAAAALAPVLAAAARAYLAARPFAPAEPARAAAAEAALLRIDAEGAAATSYPWLAVYNGLHPAIREYLLGLLALKRGDTTATRVRAQALTARAARTTAREAREFERGLAESLRAHVAAAQSRGPEALARCDAARLRVSEGLLESQLGSQACERWARAELLVRLGRLREALPWYATLSEMFIDSQIYLAPAELRQAELYERLGEDSTAARHYQRFLELWSSADPALRPQVEHAQRRLQALAAPRR